MNALKHPMIILVEDDAAQREEAVMALQLAGLAAFGVPDGQVLDQMMAQHPVDVVVLDVGLPGESGLEIAARLAARESPMGIIMLTARGMLADKLKGMVSGSDVYLVKPADPRELIANIVALRRRMSGTRLDPGQPAPLRQEGWVLSDGGHQLSYVPGGSATVTLSALQRRLLLAFRSAKTGQALNRESIMDALGHEGDVMDPHRLETLVSRLRLKVRRQLGQDLPLKAIPGLGYALTQTIGVAHA
jgi:DNA-binding response OmpR family regulator